MTFSRRFHRLWYFNVNQLTFTEAHAGKGACDQTALEIGMERQATAVICRTVFKDGMSK